MSLRALERGLALPSFWAPDEPARTASGQFSPITVTSRSEAVPAIGSDLWAHFINHTPDQAFKPATMPGGNQRDRSIEVERYAEIPREMIQGTERDDPERNPAVGQPAALLAFAVTL